MLFNAATLDGIVAGTIGAVLRRWEKPRTAVDSRHRTAVGIVEVTSVNALDDLTEPDARAAGFASIAEALDSLRPEGTLFRIGVRFAGADPRIALRESALDDSVGAAVIRLDAAAEHPWTDAVLRAIASQPGVPATVLAAQLGEERDRFKRRVRRLKELGLTESLEVGYRLSPRGRAFLGG